jgi:hypothetical protein
VAYNLTEEEQEELELEAQLPAVAQALEEAVRQLSAAIPRSLTCLDLYGVEAPTQLFLATYPFKENTPFTASQVRLNRLVDEIGNRELTETVTRNYTNAWLSIQVGFGRAVQFDAEQNLRQRGFERWRLTTVSDRYVLGFNREAAEVFWQTAEAPVEQLLRAWSAADATEESRLANYLQFISQVVANVQNWSVRLVEGRQRRDRVQITQIVECFGLPIAPPEPEPEPQPEPEPEADPGEPDAPVNEEPAPQPAPPEPEPEPQPEPEPEADPGEPDAPVNEEPQAILDPNGKQEQKRKSEPKSSFAIGLGVVAAAAAVYVTARTISKD